jgi:hypothetical protein
LADKSTAHGAYCCAQATAAGKYITQRGTAHTTGDQPFIRAGASGETGCECKCANQNDGFFHDALPPQLELKHNEETNSYFNKFQVNLLAGVVFN